MLQSEELEAIQRAAELAGQLAVMARTAGPLLEELTGLLHRISSRPPLHLVDPSVESPDLVSQGAHRLDDLG